MSKYLSLPILVVSLSTACVIVNDGGDSGTDTTSTTSDSTSDGTTGTSSSGGSTSGGGSTAGGSTSGGSTGGGSGSDSDGGSGSGSSSGGTAGGGACGWGPTGAEDPANGYVCGGEGADPDSVFPMDCPDGLEADAECGDVTGEGCCDTDGSAWYCTADAVLYHETC